MLCRTSVAPATALSLLLTWVWGQVVRTAGSAGEQPEKQTRLGQGRRARTAVISGCLCSSSGGEMGERYLQFPQSFTLRETHLVRASVRVQKNKVKNSPLEGFVEQDCSLFI